MVHSMTAFARVEQNGAYGTLSWELRSVNHRYLEPLLRLPDTLREVEGVVRETLRNGLSRGKIECTLKLTESSSESSLQVNQERAQQLIQAAELISQQIQQPAALNPMDVLAWPGVLTTQSVDSQVLNSAAIELFSSALQQLKESRGREGADLARLISERRDAIQTEGSVLRELVPQMLEQPRQKILARCQEMQTELDAQRLEQELVLLAQKSDVAEELDRLITHISEVHRVLKTGGAIGRRLDFLMQELNREANTLGSKAIDTRSTQAAVNIKVLIEQMREQVQNIE